MGLLKNLIFAGHMEEHSSDVRKQIVVISLFSLDGVVLLTVFGVDAWQKGNQLQAIIELCLAVVCAVNYLYLRRSGNYQLGNIVTVALINFLCIFLLCSGGTANTGPIWYFVLPGLIFYILGLKTGMIMLTLLFGVTLYILYVPDNFLLQTEYPSAFIHRFVASFFSMSITAFVYEYMREDGRKELLTLSRRLDQLSRLDELTGISNRRDVIERMEEEVNRLERSDRSFSVLLVDIDHFKVVNDSYGHGCGDYILQQVATTFSNNTQKRDTVARWGGEEFLLFLPETTSPQAEKTAERLRQIIESLSVSYENILISVTVSIGVAEYKIGQTINELINEGDRLLYQAKDEGRNRIKSMSL